MDCVSKPRQADSPSLILSPPPLLPLQFCSFSSSSFSTPVLSFWASMEKLGSLEPADPLPGAGPVTGVAKMEGAHGDEGPTLASSKLFWCACVKRWLPPAYREELYHVLRLTGPLVSRGKLKCYLSLLFIKCSDMSALIFTVFPFVAK